ncbi:hypothetical protein LB507_007599 [Fusarium sp. FIESC RH6]|nr:hypothetical protein LB507_007599 [Fusarium sp. FIESC RH6]
MSESSVRRACEGCRRKKTKCTGERPICSFCERLQQDCVYLPRNRETVKRKRRTSRATAGSRGRVSFGDQVGEIDELLGPPAPSSSNGSVLTPESMPNRRASVVENTSRRINRININDEPWSSSTPSPTSLDNAVEEYRRRLYFQPLPLFNPEGLRERIEKFPLFLQWIFLALALSNLPYDASSAKEADLIHSHARAARDTVLELAMRGTAQLEISQALCLLALGDILEGRPALALMTIGAASRLELVRGAGYSESASNPQGDASLRCYWSVFILEKGFAPRFTLLSQTHAKPEYPRSAREPSPPAYLGDEEYAPDLESIRDDLRTDPGITSHAVRAVSFCGDVISYLHALHIGKADNPADTNSNFYQLTNTLYDLESRLGHIHFVRNVGFSERTPEEFERHREYWAPWLLFQITAHATQALLNHPFIHLVTLRRANRPSQPRLFLQQTVDQAMFHSAWVTRLVQTCMDRGLMVYDPLIGDMVAATATIPWLFQYARDTKVSETSKENYRKCIDFLETMPDPSSRNIQKRELLHQLQTMSSQAHDNNMISFQPSKIWQLIDSDIMDAVAPSGDQGASKTTVSVQTTFVHPVPERRTERPSMSEALAGAGDLYEGLEQYSLDSIFSQPMFIDHAWLHV